MVIGTAGIKKGDVAVITALLLFALLMPLVFLGSGTGDSVSIVFEGEKTTLPLSRDAEMHFGNEKGELTLVVRDGCAFVKDSTCPDGVCKKSGRIQKEHESILCAHIGFLVKINGSKDNGEDAIAG